MSSPSLPPGIEGPVQGSLTLCLTEVAWKSAKTEIIFRVRFWGEESSGILIESSTAFLSYDIRTNFAYLLKYLLDMANLVIEVIDNQNRIIGQVKVALNTLSKSKNSINFRGKFPVVISGKPAGMATIVMKTNMKRPESEVLDSFQQNELKALREVQEIDKDKEEIQKRIVVPKRSLNRIPKPQVPGEIKEEVKKEEKAKDEITEKKIELIENVEKEGNKFVENICGQVSLHILSFESAYEESKQLLYLETYLYRPIESENNEFIPDSFTISSISRQGNIFYFNSRSCHSLETLNMKNLDLKELQLEFVLKNMQNDDFEIIGEAALAWEEILSTDSNKTVFNLSLYDGETNKGLIKVEFSLKLPQTQEEEESKTPDMLYVHLDHLYRLEGSPTIYLKYKSPVDMQSIATPIIWSYTGQPINYEIILPATDIVSRLFKKTMVFEIWEKHQEKDSLLGLGKVFLNDLCPIYPSSIYPIVYIEDYLPIISPAKGIEICYLKLCLAYGTSLQINKFSKFKKSELGTFIELNPKTQNLNNLISTKQSMKVYSKTHNPNMVEVTFLTKNQDIFN